MRKKAQFGQVISGYVDPTPEGLNLAYQRHMDNLINNESLRRQAAALQAAPFEGDQQMRRDLLSATDAALNNVTQEASKNSYGNLSNFTTSVMRAGTLYQKGATPITENLTRYQTYQQTLADALEKGEIDAEDYDINLRLSTNTYKGLSVDEEGNPTNYFSGKQAWRDPDLLGMVNQALGNISVDGNLVVQDIIGFNNGMYDVRTTEGIKQIHPDKIDAALNGVFNDPKVQGYYGRKAEGKVAFMNDEQVVAGLTKEMEQLQQAENPDLEAIGKIQQAIDSGNSQDMRAKLEFDMKNSMLDTYRQAAVIGKSQMDTVYKREVDYNPIYLESVKAQMEASAAGTSAAGIVFTGEGIEYQRPGGGTAEGADKEIRTLEDNLSSLNEQLNKAREDGLPDSSIRGLEQQQADLQRDLTIKNNAFKYIYGLDREQAKNDPEYKELQRRVRENPFHTTGGGFFTALKVGASYLMHGIPPQMAREQYRDYNSAKQDLRDYMFKNAPVQEDPAGPTGTIALNYVPLETFGMKPADAKRMETYIQDYFNAEGFKPNQLVIDPSSGKQVSLSDLDIDGMDKGQYQYDSAIFSSSRPTNGIPPHMKVYYTPTSEHKNDRKAKRGELLIPLTESSGMQIPGMMDFFNTPSQLMLSELETYKRMLEGYGAGSMDIDWAGYQGGSPTNPFYGTLDFDIENGMVTTYNAAGKEIVSKTSMNDPVFLEGVDINYIQLR